MGIVNKENYQMVFSDTPGIIDPAYKLHESMMQYVDEAIKDADIIKLPTEINLSKNIIDITIVVI